MIFTDKDMEVFEKLTEGFGFGRLQDIITLKGALEEHDCTLDDVENYVQWKKDAVLKEQGEYIRKHEEEVKPSKDAFNKVVPKCPECDALLNIKKICTEQGRKNVFGYRSVWQCLQETCFYEKYNKEKVIDLIRDLVGIEHAKKLGYSECK